MKTNFFFAFLASLFFFACQSSPQKTFAEIRIGTLKGEVLAALGSPARTYRKDDVDHWVYKLQTKSGSWILKELWIANGAVVHKEIPQQSVKPSPSDFEEIQ